MDLQSLRAEVNRAHRFPLEARRQTKVEDVQSCRVFFLVTNRNAWQWTTSRTYSSDSVHMTLESAKRTAESKRQQGSWFSIREQAALAIMTEVSTLLVLHQGVTDPFRGWQPFQMTEEAGFLNVRAIHRGITPIALVETLLPGSPHWSAWPDVLVAGAWGTKFGVEPLSDGPFTAHRSESLGANYHLDWEPQSSGHSGGGADQVASAIRYLVGPGESLRPPELTSVSLGTMCLRR